MLSILYGLISAVTWGAADFTAGIAGRRATSFQVVATSWLLGLVVMPAVAVLSGEMPMPLSGWLWCGAGGIFGISGILILYRLLAEGTMSTAVSVSAVMAGALPVAVGVVVDGLPSPLAMAGFALALSAVWLINRSSEPQARLNLRAVGLPLLSGVGFGLYFILVNRGSENHVFWPMVASRAMGGVVLGVLLLVRPRPWLPPRRVLPAVILNFLLDSTGTTAFILAGQAGRMDVAAMLSSLYPGVTILLAGWLLKERMNRWQWAGIALALVAIVMFSA